jgi:hypothetical protein
MTIAGVSKLFATENRNDEQHMPRYQVQAGEEESMKERICGEIREEYARETRDHIHTRKRKIWH